MKKILITIINIYQVLSRYGWRSNCRFYPSCSEYTREAVAKTGVLRGLFLGIKRLCKCHPFHPGGCDPVEKQ